MSASPDTADKAAVYTDTRRRIDALLGDDADWVAAMATVACELHHTFDYYDWTGFYRVVGGAAARTQATQLVPDVEQFPDHIACSSSTRSEIVVPVLTPNDRLL